MESSLGNPESRILRVFISSTFRDMQDEREELVKHVFPRLRKRCEDRGVVWGDVDLRWGISDEEKAEGKVLPICLAEIDRCRPYFICLLGDRYGWVPEQIPEPVITHYPWVKDFPDHSITDLEIIHGVFNNPNGMPHAYFYIRDPHYIDSFSIGKQHELREIPTEEELNIFGQEVSERRCTERKLKLSLLKDQIRTNGLIVRDNYSNPTALGNLVYKDFCELIDRLFPEGSDNPVEREELQQRTFASNRKSVYIENSDYYKYLDSHVLGDTPLLVVTSESGFGKSTLLVNWASHFKEAHPEIPLITHYIEASTQSADWTAMLQRLVRLSWTPYAANHFGSFESRLPDGGLEKLYRMSHIQSEVLRTSFANFLQRGFGTRTVIVIDGIDQLNDSDHVLDLDWLPEVLSHDLRLIFSCRPGRTLNSLLNHSCSILPITLLKIEERARLIHDYLAKYGKSLSPEKVKYIASTDQAANPLYLSALLEELRLYGDYATLDKFIDHYLQAQTPTQLFTKILERFEADYEREIPGLVGKTMSYLWASHRGLSEAELLDLLGSEGQPLPQVYWSEIYLAAESSLIDRSGFLSIYHKNLRDAVQLRYLPLIENQQFIHQQLAAYFQYKKHGYSARVAEEYPWHLQEAGDWQGLYDLLSDTDFLEAKWGRTNLLRGGGLFPFALSLWTKDQECPAELKSYWNAVEAHTSLRMEDAYRPVLDDPLSYVSCLLDIDQLFNETGHYKESFLIRTFLAEHCDSIGDRASLARALLLLAACLSQQGDLNGALIKIDEAEKVFIGLGDTVGRQECRLRLDSIKKVRDGSHQVKKVPRQTEAFYKSALIHIERGELDQAMQLLKQAEEIDRNLGEKTDLGRILDQQSMIYAQQNKIELALGINTESETLFRESGDLLGLTNTMQNRVFILGQIGSTDEALQYFESAEKVYRGLNHPKELFPCLFRQANLFYYMKKPREALLLMIEAYDLACANDLQQEMEFSKKYLDEIRSKLTFSFKLKE
jgi:tetratricopeptide (TPR) repeat protein